MTETRNYKFDNIKAFLIFMVVLGHVLEKFGDSVTTFTIYKIIFSFHMPAFLFISGYFAKYNPKKYLSNLIPLCLIFQIVQLSLESFVTLATKGSWVFPKIQFFKPAWTMWYLYALIIYQLLIPLFDTKDTKYRTIYMMSAFLTGLAIGLNKDTDNFLAISRIMVFSPFFLAGYYEKDMHFITKIISGKYKWLSRFISLILVSIIILFLILYSQAIPYKLFYGTESYNGGAITWITRLISWLVSFIWIWFIVSWFPNKKIKIITSIGTNSLAIYLLHTILICIMNNIPSIKMLVYNNIPIMIIASLVITLLTSLNIFDKTLRNIKIPLK